MTDLNCQKIPNIHVAYSLESKLMACCMKQIDIWILDAMGMKLQIFNKISNRRRLKLLKPLYEKNEKLLAPLLSENSYSSRSTLVS